MQNTIVLLLVFLNTLLAIVSFEILLMPVLIIDILINCSLLDLFSLIRALHWATSLVSVLFWIPLEGQLGEKNLNPLTARNHTSPRHGSLCAQKLVLIETVLIILHLLAIFLKLREELPMSTEGISIQLVTNIMIFLKSSSVPSRTHCSRMARSPLHKLVLMGQ